VIASAAGIASAAVAATSRTVTVPGSRGGASHAKTGSSRSRSC
jgi:hypothetical protein